MKCFCRDVLNRLALGVVIGCSAYLPVSLALFLTQEISGWSVVYLFAGLAISTILFTLSEKEERGCHKPDRSSLGLRLGLRAKNHIHPQNVALLEKECPFLYDLLTSRRPGKSATKIHPDILRGQWRK